MEVMQDQKRTLSVENAELRNIITTKSRNLDITNERLQTLTVSNDDLINEVASLKTNIHHLCASIRTMDADGFALVIQIQHITNELHTMKQQLTDRGQDIDELQRLLSNKDVQLQAWQTNTAGSIRAFTQQISELLEEKQALQQENEEFARDFEQLIGSCGADAARELEVRLEGVESDPWATSSSDAEVEEEQSEDETDDEESRNEIGTGEVVTSEAVSKDNGAFLLSEYEDMQAIEGIEV
jgi:chromosome segregation ATPase